VNKITVSQLELFIDCPQKALQNMLVPDSDPHEIDETLDNRNVGTIFHETFARFFADRFENIFNRKPLTAAEIFGSGLSEFISENKLSDENSFKATLDIFYYGLSIAGAVGDFRKLLKDKLEVIKSDSNNTTPFLQSDILYFEYNYLNDIHLTNLMTQLFSLRTLPLAFEVEVTYKPSDCDITLSGRIDRIDLSENGSLLLVDYKKTYKSDTKKKISQLPIYCFMVSECHFDDLQYIYVPYSNNPENKFGLRKFECSNSDIIKTALADIVAGDFSPKLDRKCNECQYSEVCRFHV
jgi:hypothetical protein